jgi:type IV secretory pathway TraG/TraD family ATPase VirD4
LLQAIRTQISLGTSDPDTAKYVADYVGKTDKLKMSVNVSESSQDANVSLLSGKTVGDKSSVSQAITYTTQKEYVFEPHEVIQLKNATAVAVIFDGQQTHAQSLFTVPYFTSRTKTWHQKWEDGDLESVEKEDTREAYEPTEGFLKIA